MAHRLTAIDPEAQTADCEECGPGVGIRLHRPARRPNGYWRCRKAARKTPEAKQRQDRRLWLRRAYGITVEEYAAMFEAQGGRCAICGRACDVLAVDHCHRAGHVRSLLCTNCNVGLGQFGDDPARLRAAAEYLET